jgi:phosphoglycerate transporter family protein
MTETMLALFRAPPPRTQRITDPIEVARAYAYWRPRILLASTVGYALFYFVRKNLPVAMPVMARQLGISKTDLGLFLTLHGVIYGVSKFANGFLGDRANARTFMAAGLLLSALANVIFGSSSLVIVFGIVWMLNGWFQGMGFPPCARLLTHWFSPKELATKMSLWNMSHSLGAGAVLILCGYLATRSWRLCFFVPAALAAAASVYLLITLRDTPESLGLPAVPGTESTPRGEETETPDAPGETFWQFLLANVFSNRTLWLISIANFFVYTVRYAVLDWGPTLLGEAKGVRLANAGWMMAGFEFAGAIGAVLAGWMTDRFLGGRGVRACVVYMLLCAGAITAFWKLPAGSSLLANAALLCAAGFFVYGPQCLIGVTAANLATKRAAATAVGLTGLFGYLSTVLSGWGLGLLVQRHGWNAGFAAMIAVALIGTVLLALAWNAPSHGYATIASRNTAAEAS